MNVQTKFWIGDKVIIGGSIPAIITALQVSNNDTIEYRCSYFYEGNYCNNWLSDFEISSEKPIIGQIGYKGGA